MQEGGDAMSRLSDPKPSSVPETAKQGGETRSRWLWVEPAVWTERMLAALEEVSKAVFGLA